jgi:hypothetical protein
MVTDTMSIITSTYRVEDGSSKFTQNVIKLARLQNTTSQNLILSTKPQVYRRCQYHDFTYSMNNRMVNEYGAAGGMRISKENFRTPCPSATLSTTNPT